MRFADCPLRAYDRLDIGGSARVAAYKEKNMVRDPAYGLSAEALEYARKRYEETNDLQSSVSADLPISRGTLNRIAKAQGWQLRKDRPPRGLSPALKLDITATEA